MLDRSKASVLLLLAGFILTPQFVLAKDGFPDDSGSGVTFATPKIPLPSNIQTTTDSSGRTEFRLRSTTQPSVSPRVGSGDFCAKFSDATGGVSSDLTQRYNELQTQFQQRADKIKSDFKTITTTQTTNRTKADTALTDKFKDLEAKATTDAQKQAVTDFEAAVKAAVAARRAAVDAANAAFQQGLLSSTSTRQTALKQAAADYKADVQAALAAAKASCAAGTAPATVRTTLKSALEAARTKLETARQAAGKQDDPALAALKATRKAAVDKANADFKTAMQAALTKLKAALGTSTKTPAPSSSPSPVVSASPTI